LQSGSSVNRSRRFCRCGLATTRARPSSSTSNDSPLFVGSSGPHADIVCPSSRVADFDGPSPPRIVVNRPMAVGVDRGQEAGVHAPLLRLTIPDIKGGSPYAGQIDRRPRGARLIAWPLRIFKNQCGRDPRPIRHRAQTTQRVRWLRARTKPSRCRSAAPCRR